MLTLTPTPLDHPDAAALILLLQAHYLEIYGGHDDTPHAAAEFSPPAGYFVVGYVDGVAVACGGWRARDEDEPPLRPGDAEIKRMFVHPAHRGRGLARAVLADLEAAAAARRTPADGARDRVWANPRRSTSTSARGMRRWRRSALIAIPKRVATTPERCLA